MNKSSSKIGSRIMALIVTALFVSLGAGTALAAKGEEAVSGSSGPTAAEERNVEKILNTLNETLKENRRIRQNVRDLQDTFEKLTAERNALLLEVQKTQGGQATQERESAKAEALKTELDASLQEIKRLEGSSQELETNRQAIQAKNLELNAANEKLQGLLDQSVTEPERSRIIELAKTNEEAVHNSVGMVAGVNSENLMLKDQLVGARFDLGNVYYDLGRYDEAIDQYEKALHLNPKLAWAYHNLAIVYDYHLNKQKEARAYYQKYLNLKPPSEEARKVQMRLWDLKQLARIEPGVPLKPDFDKMQKKT